jgi:AIPR protein/AAA domain/UvrD-like helicase C-terminal domain
MLQRVVTHRTMAARVPMAQINKELSTFVEEIHREVLSRSEADGGRTSGTDVFMELMIGHLADAGEIDDAAVCFHKARGEEVGAYSVSERGDSVDLLIAHRTQTTPPEKVGKAEVDAAFKRLFNFFKKAMLGGYSSLEETSPVHDMCLRIHEVRSKLRTVRFFVITDGLTTAVKRKDAESGGIKASYHVWDIERFHRCVTSGQFREPIEVDLKKLAGEPIACLPMPGDATDYKAYLAIIRGDVLAKLYDEFGPRLLERNVRSFLQARGKVNKKLQETIAEEPERFLAYNNGISVTASELRLEEREDGTQGIVWAKDFQIVNGGQTTASIYHSMKSKKGLDVSRVYVQAKISVVDPSLIDDLVPLISRYANSQNKVNEVDFFANDAFHVRVDQLSRTVWAPVTGDGHRQTRWIYERARGQYQDSRGREATAALRKEFDVTHPPAQKFTKTDLAKFENTWEMLPHFVSRGAEKNFREFAVRLAARKEGEPDQRYFERLVAKAIIFRTAEEIIQALKFGAYKANIVTYTVSLILERTDRRIDLQRVWREQAVSPAFAEAIRTVSKAVNEGILASSNGKNVTEWCKKEECWYAIRSLDVGLLPALEAELVTEKRDAPVQPGLNGSTGSNGKPAEKPTADDGPADNGTPSWDADQTGVIEAPSSDRLLVDAGPGTGKTAVACARVASLIHEAGISPANILLVSFTRTAVAELRSRIASYLGSESVAAAVRIATLDAEAFRLQTGFSCGEVDFSAGYDENIAKVISLINAGSDELDDYLRRMKHLIVDEAQDLYGPRATLVIQLVRSVTPQCGITVFADPGQAIYGFTVEDGWKENAGLSLLAQLGSEQPPFEGRTLRTIHRTDSPQLISIFSGTRPLLARGDMAGHEQLRSEILARAAGQFPDDDELRNGNSRLLLYRFRRDVLSRSQVLSDAGIEHRIRMSSTPACVHPWIGWLLAFTRTRYIDARGLASQFVARDMATIFPGIDPESAFHLLRGLAPGDANRIDLKRLCSMLSRTRPSIEVCSPDLGRAGPIVSTIHASKGREADDVVLSLPPRPEDGDNIGEETRILYVGATRPRRSLVALDAASTKAYRLASGRIWRVANSSKPGNYLWATVELGLDWDVNTTARVRPPLSTTPQDAEAGQRLLAESAGKFIPLFSRCAEEWKWKHRLFLDESELFCVGQLSKAVQDDFRYIAGWFGSHFRTNVCTPWRITGLRLFGVRTIAIAEDDKMRPFLHEPYRTSGFLLAPIFSGFPTLKFKKRGS